ncbi:hypothetical protein ACM66B_006173 [Microbotryomycetes sp. NB124-2]
MGRPSPAYYDALLLEKCKLMLEKAMAKPLPGAARRSAPWDAATSSYRPSTTYEQFVEALDPEWTINVAAFEAIVRETTERLHPSRRGLSAATATITRAHMRDNIRRTRPETIVRARTAQTRRPADDPGASDPDDGVGDEHMPDSIDLIRHSRRLQMMTHHHATDDLFMSSALETSPPLSDGGIELFFPPPSTQDQRDTTETTGQDWRATPPDELLSVDLDTTAARSHVLPIQDSVWPGDHSSQLQDLFQFAFRWAHEFGFTGRDTASTDVLQVMLVCLNMHGLFPQNYSLEEIRALERDIERRHLQPFVDSLPTTYIPRASSPRPSGAQLLEAASAAMQQMASHSSDFHPTRYHNSETVLPDSLIAARVNRILTPLRQARTSSDDDSIMWTTPAAAAFGAPVRFRYVRQRVTRSGSSSLSDNERSRATTSLSTPASATPLSSLARSPAHSGPCDHDHTHGERECHAAPVELRLTSADIAEAAALSRRRIAPLPTSTRSAARSRRA